MSFTSTGIVAIVLSTIISFILSVSANMQGAELGALYNLVIPPFAGLLSLIVFLLVNWLPASRHIKIPVLVISCIYLIYAGVVLHADGGYLPFPF